MGLTKVRFIVYTDRNPQECLYLLRNTQGNKHMNEVMYKYEKGKGWVTSSDPERRIYWQSPDQTHVIVRVIDMPEGIPRTQSKSPTFRGSEKSAIDLIKYLLEVEGLICKGTYNFPTDDLAAYKTADVMKAWGRT